MSVNAKKIEDERTTNLFISQKINKPEKVNQRSKKRYIRFISIKRPYFKIENNSNVDKKKSLYNPNCNNGRWTEEEKNRFIQGIILYGINWKKVKILIPTRNAVQIRSHAQKFFNKLKLCKDENLGIDFTLDSVNNIKDMINQIKSKNPDCNAEFILRKLYNGCINRKLYKNNKKISNNKCEIYNNIWKIENKNELINLEENNNFINKNETLNQNNMNINLFENNKFYKIINNNFNNNYELNNVIQFKNIKFIENNTINNNDNIFPNKLNNSLNLNSSNDSLSDNNLLNNYLGKPYITDLNIDYFALANDLILTKFKLINIINSIDYFYTSILQNFNSLNNIPNSLVNNNIPIKNNNNSLIINNFYHQIDNNIPLVNDENKGNNKDNI